VSQQSGQSVDPVFHLGEPVQVLIVEDNDDLVFYIKSCLNPDYQIFAASDGVQGEELAVEKIPDIIISDIMMPKQNGLDLCKKLKNDERTSHIPIILLTAKSTIEDRIAGIEHGADAYLAKPFSERELQVRIEKLLETRQKLREKFSQSNWQEKPAEIANKQDLEFIEKVKNLLEKHLTDEDLGPDFLAAKLFVSRTQLHRKLKAITNLSTSHFINHYRIEKAKRLLKTTDLTIDQIAYDVGYANPSYFRRIFQKHLGKSATTYRSDM
jgi:YesN/AraC family two-component response regulator